MIPVDFKGTNIMFDKPANMDREECEPLMAKACLMQDRDAVMLVSCWKLTIEDLEAIQRTGRIYLAVCGASMPPVILSGPEIPSRDLP